MHTRLREIEHQCCATRDGALFGRRRENENRFGGGGAGYLHGEIDRKWPLPVRPSVVTNQKHNLINKSLNKGKGTAYQTRQSDSIGFACLQTHALEILTKFNVIS